MLKHGIEKSNKLFEKQKRDEVQEQLKQLKTPKEKAMKIANDTKNFIIENRIEMMLLVLIFMMLKIWMKINALE